MNGPWLDHPQMSVRTRVLQGHVEVQSFDWHPKGSPKAIRHPTASLEAPATASLEADEGNIHSFSSGPEGCTILDVLLPPYDDDLGRPCNYYRHEEGDGSSEGQCLLLTCDPGDDFVVLRSAWPPPQDGT